MTSIVASHKLNETISFSSPIHAFKSFVSPSCLEKTKEIGLSSFKMCSTGYLFSFGTIEIGKSLIKITCRKNEKAETRSQKILNSSNGYLMIHGSLMAATGGFNFIDILSDFGVIVTSNFKDAIRLAGNLFFLGSHIIALAENIRLYEALKRNPDVKNEMSEDQKRLFNRSVCWGIISNVGYIFATSTLLFSGMTALTLIIALFSCFAGGIKILYDLHLSL